MLTIAGGILLAIALWVAGSMVLALIGLPISLLVDQLKFAKRKTLPSRHYAYSDLGSDGREGSEY